MPLPTEIQSALRVYDDNKGFWRRLFRRDQAAIRALRTLNDADQTNLLKIYQCFIENLPKNTQASYKVLHVALNKIDFSAAIMIDELYAAKLLKHSNLDILNNLDANQFEKLASILKKLSTAQLLTQQNLASIAPYYETPEKLSIIDNAVNALVDTNRLKQENFSELSELLKELYHNQLLTQENTDHLVHLLANNIRVLTHLLKKLSSNDFLTQANFDSVIQCHQEAPGYIGIIACAVDILNGRRLNQENLNSLLEKPMQAANMASALKVLDENGLLTPTNRIELCNDNNQFLLSNAAYNLVWRPLETYLPTLAQIDEGQSVFDRIIDLAQQENPEENIKKYLDELNSEPNLPRVHHDVKFNTAPPPSRRNTGDSIASKDRHNQFSRQPTI